jgi:hypothetical protein
MTAVSSGLKHYTAAALLHAGMFACMAVALVLWNRDAPVVLTLAPILPATLMSLAAINQLRRVRTLFDRADTAPATGEADSNSKPGVAVATVIFFTLTTVSTFACTLLVLYSMPALRPNDDFFAVALLLSVSVTYSILVSSFFFGAVGRYTL